MRCILYRLRSAEAIGKAPIQPQVHSAKGKTVYRKIIFNSFKKKTCTQINLFEYSNQQFISFVIQGSGIISENFMNKIIRWTHAIKMMVEDVAVFTCSICLYSGHMSLYIGRQIKNGQSVNSKKCTMYAVYCMDRLLSHSNILTFLRFRSCPLSFTRRAMCK